MRRTRLQKRLARQLCAREKATPGSGQRDSIPCFSQDRLFVIAAQAASGSIGNIKAIMFPWLTGRVIGNAQLPTSGMPVTRWDAQSWPTVKTEFSKALALRSRIARAGGFN